MSSLISTHYCTCFQLTIISHTWLLKIKVLRDLQDSENIQYDACVVDECHNTLVQTHGTYNTKTEPCSNVISVGLSFVGNTPLW